jgi:hypothetical protein
VDGSSGSAISLPTDHSGLGPRIWSLCGEHRTINLTLPHIYLIATKQSATLILCSLRTMLLLTLSSGSFLPSSQDTTPREAANPCGPKEGPKVRAEMPEACLRGQIAISLAPTRANWLWFLAAHAVAYTKPLAHLAPGSLLIPARLRAR